MIIKILPTLPHPTPPLHSVRHTRRRTHVQKDALMCTPSPTTRKVACTTSKTNTSTVHSSTEKLNIATDAMWSHPNTVCHTWRLHLVECRFHRVGKNIVHNPSTTQEHLHASLRPPNPDDGVAPRRAAAVSTRHPLLAVQLQRHSQNVSRSTRHAIPSSPSLPVLRVHHPCHHMPFVQSRRARTEPSRLSSQGAT